MQVKIVEMGYCRRREGHLLHNVARLTRLNFLPLTIVIVLAGLAAAFYSHRVFKPIDAGLVLVGALLTHAAVNAFNNYFDYRSKIDEKTAKTPFSGGVEVIVGGMMKPPEALSVSIICLAGAALIGIYFLSQFLSLLLPLVVFGALAIVLYSPLIARVHAVSEVAAGLGFGLMGLGVYITQAGEVTAAGIAIFVPITILVALLLFLNEFPDMEVDRGAGRRHLVILLGKRRSAWLYVAGLAATDISIILSAALGATPLPTLIALFPVPIAFKAGRIALENYGRMPELIPAMGLNVIFILSTIFLMAAGFAVASFLSI